MHQLHPVMERFYLSALDYADLKVEDNVLMCKNEKLGDFTVEDRNIALPYFNLLKNPEGKLFFHLLNENYASPENAVFDQYRNMLLFTINTKLAHLVITMIALAGDVQLQQKITSGKLIQLISGIGEVDPSIIEAFKKILKGAYKKDSYSPLVDIYLKKNGEINGTPYAAIGKVNFKFFEELRKATDRTEKDYKVFDVTVRKKDVLALYSIMEALFPNIDTKDYYVEGTDNKIFRYLNALLKTSYLVTSRMNEIGEMMLELKEPALAAEEIISNHDWVNELETLYGMATEIRLIPSQVDINVEAKRIKIDESKAAQASTQQQPQQPVQAPMQQAPSFNPGMTQPQQPQQQPIQQQQQPQQLTPEDIIRNSMQQQMNPMAMMGIGNPMMMQQPMMNPMIGMQQPSTPSWVQAELMKEQQQQLQQQMQYQQQQPQMNPMMMPGMQMPMQQPMMNNPMMMNQMPMQQPMMQPQQGGLQINPHFMNQARAPWN